MKVESKAKFKEVLISHLAKVPHGTVTTDTELSQLCSNYGLTLNNKEIQECVRGAETQIAKNLKVRAVRVSKLGYRIISGAEHLYQVAKESTGRMVRAATKAAKRLDGVDVVKLTRDEKESLVASKIAYTALGAVLKNTESMKSLKIDDVKALTSAQNEIAALEQFKKIC